MIMKVLNIANINNERQRENCLILPFRGLFWRLQKKNIDFTGF